MLDGAQEVVRCNETCRRVFDGCQTAVESGADVAHEHMRLVRIVDLPQLHCPRRFELQQRIQPIGDDGLVKSGGKFAGLRHRSGGLPGLGAEVSRST